MEGTSVPNEALFDMAGIIGLQAVQSKRTCWKLFTGCSPPAPICAYSPPPALDFEPQNLDRSPTGRSRRLAQSETWRYSAGPVTKSPRRRQLPVVGDDVRSL